MTTLVPIPKEAREKMEEGQAVLLGRDEGQGIALCFAEDYPDAQVLPVQEETRWDHLKGEE
jgi:hypothetical protein